MVWFLNGASGDWVVICLMCHPLVIDDMRTLGLKDMSRFAITLLLILVLYTVQIFRKEPFFYGHDNYDQLVKIAKVLVLAVISFIKNNVVQKLPMYIPVDITISGSLASNT